MDETLSTYSGQPVRTNGKLNSLAYPHYFKNTGKRGKKKTPAYECTCLIRPFDTFVFRDVLNSYYI